jgi:hypothetical protein
MRTHTFDQNPQVLDTFAKMLSEGVGRAEIADALGINKSTVTEWKKRPDVQQRWAKYVEERANRICSQTDTRIEALLRERGDEMSVDQLLKIRHEYAGDKVTVQSGDGANALQQLLEEAHRNPEAAAALSRVLPDERDGG